MTRTDARDARALREFGARHAEKLLNSDKYNPNKVIHFTGR